MKPGGGKQKGGAYERELARTISEWWFHEPDACWRGQASGARKTRKGENVNIIPGDIVPIKGGSFPWPWAIEAKCWRKWTFDQFLRLEGKSQVVKWFRELEDKVGLDWVPMLICTRLYDIDYVVLDANYIRISRVYDRANELQIPRLILENKDLMLFVMPLKLFIRITREEIWEWIDSDLRNLRNAEKWSRY